jgi:hypothetical protein
MQRPDAACLGKKTHRSPPCGANLDPAFAVARHLADARVPGGNGDGEQTSRPLR